MRKSIILCLVLVFLASAASARPVDRDPSERLSLIDLVDSRSGRYYEGYSISRFPKSERRLQIPPDLVQDPLDKIYARPASYRYTVQPNDTLKKIARAHSTTVEFLKALNKITGSHLKAGQKLAIPVRVFSIEINKTLNRLYLKAGDVLIKEYPVSTGKSVAQTPLGIFLIQSRYPYPVWFHKGHIVPGGASDNFLGTRWLGFDKPQYGLHGTIFPELIGQSVSKGCVRMRNEDVEELYEFIPVGTMVVITEI
ncbi:MAG: L,D-transpeptidase family protein [Candidatus Omnitrophica bacterium]|nr:L,D-transpeptidase family protein [Candidatus Omnitrophota bacterium]